MGKKLHRLTIDIETEEHRRLKARASMKGETIRSYVLELIQKDMETPAKNFDVNRYLESVKGSATVKMSTDEIMRLTRGE